MSKSLIRFSLVFLLIHVVACKNGGNGTKVVDEFAFEDSASLTSVDSVVATGTFYAWNAKLDNDILVLNASSQDSIVRVFDFPELSLKSVFGTLGHSGDEFISANWCATTNHGFGLYDMMKKKLFVYDVSEGNIRQAGEFNLPEDEDGMAPPYTKICQYNDSLFIVKEDGDETNLRLMNLASGKCLSNYHIDLRKADGQPYTPYDFEISVCGNAVCLTYSYLDRVELLKVTEDNNIVPVCLIGESKFENMPSDYDLLPTRFISIAHSGDRFYCLRGDKGQSCGREVMEFSLEGDMLKKYRLDCDATIISVDSKGQMVAVSETDSHNVFHVYDLK